LPYFDTKFDTVESGQLYFFTLSFGVDYDKRCLYRASWVIDTFCQKIILGYVNDQQQVQSV